MGVVLVGGVNRMMLSGREDRTGEEAGGVYVGRDISLEEREKKNNSNII